MGESLVARSSKVSALLLAMTLKRKEFEKFVMLKVSARTYTTIYVYTGCLTYVALMG